MLQPWEYRENLLLVSTDHGSFLAVNKTLEECMVYHRDVVRGGRGFSVTGWNPIILDEPTYLMLHDIYSPIGRVLE